MSDAALTPAQTLEPAPFEAPLPTCDPCALTPAQTLERLHAILADKGASYGFDTEGFEWTTCLSFATTRWALVIDTLGLRGHPAAGPIWAAVRAIVESPDIVKVCWNAGHERGFLQWAHGWTLRAYEDPMFCWAEKWPELPKRLKYAASILTRLPCWTEGISFREEDEEAQASGPLLWRYNGHDSVATLQLWKHPQLQPAPAAPATRLGTSTCAPVGLSPRQWARYRFNLSLIEPLNYASQKGIRYDHERATQLREQLTPQLWEAQAAVDEAAGLQVPEGEALLEYVKAKCCTKAAVKRGLVRDLEGAQRHALKDYRGSLERVSQLLDATHHAGAATRGEIGALLGCGLNVKSTKAVVACLNRLGLPPVFKPGKRKVNPDASGDAEPSATPSQSKDQEALLKLFLKTRHPITTAILRVVALRGRLQELDRGVGRDGRIRCSFTVGYGTESGRTTSHKWLDGSGGNLTTVPKEPTNFRVLYRADEGHTCQNCRGDGLLDKHEWTSETTPCPVCKGTGTVSDYLWWKLDLTGADLWTVACRCASLGDPTMLEDLRAGIRIPSLVGLLMDGYQTKGVPRDQLRADCVAYRARLKASGEGWKDTLWKKASHLTNYGGKPPRIRQGVIDDSYSETGTPIDPGLPLCVRVQQLYLARYWGLPKWWADVGSRIVKTGCLEMANGKVREFLSRRPRLGQLDDETRREALATEPQEMTTWACNLALHRLWHDLENWPSGVVGQGDPVIQPLNFIHDEIAGQCPSTERPFLVAKLRAAFDNELTIGRCSIRIPFAGATGPNWGECRDPI